MTTTTTTSTDCTTGQRPAVRSWPLLLLAAPAGVAIWAGWVGLGKLTGFGQVQLLPGIWDAARIDSAITLPIGVETYAAYALRVWLTAGPDTDPRAVRFAKASALASLLLGAAGQVAYHLMSAAQMVEAPWQITTLVACLPVAVLGMGAALAHLVHHAAPGTPDAAPGAAETEEMSGPVAEPEPDTAAPEPPTVEAAPSVREDTQGTPATSAIPARLPKATTGRRPADTASRVARLRAAHPDWTNAQIAKRTGLSVRTVARYPATPKDTGPDTGSDTRTATKEDTTTDTAPARRPDTSNATTTDTSKTIGTDMSSDIDRTEVAA